MKKSVAVLLAACLFTGTGFSALLQAQEYVPTPVTISTETVKNDGKIYYSHVVLEKQTLFSISKAYGVTLQEIYDANPKLDLEEKGLKTFQILLIPKKDADVIREEAKTETTAAAETAQPAEAEKISVEPQGSDFIYHTVKWYENLSAIAKKYGVSEEAIMKANNMSSPAVSKKQRLRIPIGADVEGTPQEAEEDSVRKDGKAIVETIIEEVGEAVGGLFPMGKKDITAALILPFNAQKQPNDNNLDFYSGVLMAARDLKDEGINVDLSVYDAAGGVVPVTEEKFGECDLVLGPISAEDISKVLQICPSDTPVISPLEPKAAELASSYSNLIQAPVPSEIQGKDLVNWLKSDIRRGDKVILCTEKGASPTATVATLIQEMKDSGIEYTTLSYGLLDGSRIADRIEAGAPADHSTRILIASESEAFVSDIVRNANLLTHRKFDIVLYSPSKIRSFETIEVESLHNTKLHVSLSYYVDYDTPEVQKFLMAYRALFNTEPGPFAFQGYDTADTFIRMCSKYGNRWTDKLGTTETRGLQSNFGFSSEGAEGKVNNAVRRIVYGPDFSITLVN